MDDFEREVAAGKKCNSTSVAVPSNSQGLLGNFINATELMTWTLGLKESQSLWKSLFPLSRRYLTPTTPRLFPRVLSPPPNPSFREEIAKSVGSRSFVDAVGRPSARKQCFVSSPDYGHMDI